MSKTNDLLGALADSMDKKPKSEPVQEIPKQATGEGKPLPKKSKEPKQETPKAVFRKAKVSTVSLYEEDFYRIDRIREILQNNFGGSYPNSLIIRLALHTSTNEPNKLKKTLEKLKEQDGRKKK